jgi:hypothetical protein
MTNSGSISNNISNNNKYTMSSYKDNNDKY